jgi:hypothetical protein
VTATAATRRSLGGAGEGAAEAPQTLIHRTKASNPRQCLRSGRLTPHGIVRWAVAQKGAADAKSTP